MDVNHSILIIKGKQFRAYPPEEGVAIIRTIAEHRWPMTINEAFALRDRFNWKPAPDNGRFFTTAVSNGEEDGYIGCDVKNSDLVSRFDINLTTRLSQDAPPELEQIIYSSYSSYVNALNIQYGEGSSKTHDGIISTRWQLSSRVKIAIAGSRRLIGVTIESPAMMDLTEAEQRYFDEGGVL